MPLYEYRCSFCSHGEEILQRLSDPSLPSECPRCGRDGYRRVIPTGTGFRLKGTGWGADNYGTPKPKKEGT